MDITHTPVYRLLRTCKVEEMTPEETFRTHIRSTSIGHIHVRENGAVVDLLTREWDQGEESPLDDGTYFSRWNEGRKETVFLPYGRTNFYRPGPNDRNAIDIAILERLDDTPSS